MRQAEERSDPLGQTTNQVAPQERKTLDKLKNIAPIGKPRVWPHKYEAIFGTSISQ